MFGGFSQTFFDEDMRPEQIEHALYFRVHIAYPNESVALYAVPKPVLHVEIKSVRRDFKNLVDLFVVAAKTSAGLFFEVSIRRVNSDKSIIFVG